MLPKELRPHKKEIVRIFTEICSRNPFTVYELRGRSRQGDLSNCRQFAIYLIRESTQASFRAIGALFGGRCSKAAWYAHDEIRSYLVTDPVSRARVEEILSQKSGGKEQSHDR